MFSADGIWIPDTMWIPVPRPMLIIRAYDWAAAFNNCFSWSVLPPCCFVICVNSSIIVTIGRPGSPPSRLICARRCCSSHNQSNQSTHSAIRYRVGRLLIPSRSPSPFGSIMHTSAPWFTIPWPMTRIPFDFPEPDCPATRTCGTPFDPISMRRTFPIRSSPIGAPNPLSPTGYGRSSGSGFIATSIRINRLDIRSDSSGVTRCCLPDHECINPVANWFNPSSLHIAGGSTSRRIHRSATFTSTSFGAFTFDFTGPSPFDIKSWTCFGHSLRIRFASRPHPDSSTTRGRRNHLPHLGSSPNNSDQNTPTTCPANMNPPTIGAFTHTHAGATAATTRPRMTRATFLSARQSNSARSDAIHTMLENIRPCPIDAFPFPTTPFTAPMNTPATDNTIRAPMAARTRRRTVTQPNSNPPTWNPV